MQLVYYTSINATNQSNLRCVLQKRKKEMGKWEYR